MPGILLIAAIDGLLTVALGAFAAHALRDSVSIPQADWFETGVRYQAWHCLALLVVAVLMAVRPARLLYGVTAAFVLGSVIFSGSLYGLALSGERAFAMATPFGGGFLLLGWALLAVYAVKSKRH